MWNVPVPSRAGSPVDWVEDLAEENKSPLPLHSDTAQVTIDPTETVAIVATVAELEAAATVIIVETMIERDLACTREADLLEAIEIAIDMAAVVEKDQETVWVVTAEETDMPKKKKKKKKKNKIKKINKKILKKVSRK
jgi:hypothetical protein